MHKRVLIVGTVPYNKKSTSRAFESYFKNWEKENLFQIFSNTKTPAKGHCSQLYQITDIIILMSLFNKNIKIGRIFRYDELPEEWENQDLEVNSSLVSKLYGLGKEKTPFIYLLRKLLWSKNKWHNEYLDNWVDMFNPECIFLSFSDDFFILEIALFYAQKFNIPIISSIGDDYFFNFNLTLSPIYYLYKLMYRKLVSRVLMHKGNSIYIGDKIKNKYNEYFNLDGKTIYLTSELKMRDFSEINCEKPIISYCGNIRLGRNHSLRKISESLSLINKNYVVNVYSNEDSNKYLKVLKKCKNIIFHGSVSYNEVENIIFKSDINLVVEGFSKRDIDQSRYSLSTKVADLVNSGTNIFAFGSLDCGAIEYIKTTKVGYVCTNQKELTEKLKEFITNKNLQIEFYEQCKLIKECNHNLKRNTEIFEDLVNEVTGNVK